MSNLGSATGSEMKGFKQSMMAEGRTRAGDSKLDGGSRPGSAQSVKFVWRLGLGGLRRTAKDPNIARASSRPKMQGVGDVR